MLPSQGLRIRTGLKESPGLEAENKAGVTLYDSATSTKYFTPIQFTDGFHLPLSNEDETQRFQ